MQSLIDRMEGIKKKIPSDYEQIAELKRQHALRNVRMRKIEPPPVVTMVDYVFDAMVMQSLSTLENTTETINKSIMNQMQVHNHIDFTQEKCDKIVRETFELMTRQK